MSGGLDVEKVTNPVSTAHVQDATKILFLPRVQFVSASPNPARRRGLPQQPQFFPGLDRQINQFLAQNPFNSMPSPQYTPDPFRIITARLDYTQQAGVDDRGWTARLSYQSMDYSAHNFEHYQFVTLEPYMFAFALQAYISIYLIFEIYTQFAQSIDQ